VYAISKEIGACHRTRWRYWIDNAQIAQSFLKLLKKGLAKNNKVIGIEVCKMKVSQTQTCQCTCIRICISKSSKSPRSADFDSVMVTQIKPQMESETQRQTVFLVMCRWSTVGRLKVHERRHLPDACGYMNNSAPHPSKKLSGCNLAWWPSLRWRLRPTYPGQFHPTCAGAQGLQVYGQ
jgi:hypothetical protein